MIETLWAIYVPVWFALAIGSLLFFWRRDPAFKKRWYRRVSAFNLAIIGGTIVLMTIPNWRAFAIFLAGLLFLGWASVFQTRVCLSCGKVSQPDTSSPRPVSVKSAVLALMMARLRRVPSIRSKLSFDRTTYRKAPRPIVISGPASPITPSWNQVVGCLTDWEGLRRLAARDCCEQILPLTVRLKFGT